MTTFASTTTPSPLGGNAKKVGRQRSSGRVFRVVLVLVDLCGAGSAWLIALVVSGESDWIVAAVAVGAGLVAMAALRLYRAHVCTWLGGEIEGLVRTTAISLGFAAAAAWLRAPSIPAGTIVAAEVLSLTFAITLRRWVTWWLRSRHARGRNLRPVVLVAGGLEASRLIRLFDTQPELGYRPCGVVADRGGADLGDISVPWLGPPGGTVRAVREAHATGVILSSAGLDPTELNRLLRELLAAGIHVQLSIGLTGVEVARVRAAPIAHEPFFYVEPDRATAWQRAVKRALDVSVATIALIATSPLLLIAALAVKLQDGGPVFIHQERVGRNGAPFILLKLRTMVVDAPRQLEALYARNERRDGPLFKLTSDPRTTFVGRFLRVTSIDELPQLLNVLQGTMSLVGPRPAFRHEVARFDEELLARLTVRPGITGLWQIEARDNPEFAVYRRLDLFYVENWSLWLDIALLLATPCVVVERAVRALGRVVRTAWAPAELPAEQPGELA